MTCYLLHLVEQPDQTPYDDPNVKDVVGTMPQFFCAHCQPIKRLLPSSAMKCLDREGPCWMPPDRICADR